MQPETNQGFGPTVRHRRGRGRRVFWMLVGVGAVLALLAAGPGFGQRRPPHGCAAASADRLTDRLEHALDAIDASPEARRRISDATAETVSDLRDLSVECEALQGEIGAALGAEDLDPQTLEGLRVAARRNAADSVDRMLDLAVEVAAVLSPEQRTKLLEHGRGR